MQDSTVQPLVASPGRGGVPLALASALLFGLGAPLAKLLVGQVDPWLLAGLLYLGSGVGLAAAWVGSRWLRAARAEANLRRADLPWLALTVILGASSGRAC